MQVNIAGMVEVRTEGEFQGVALGEVSHGCVVGVQPASKDAVERLALLLPYTVYNQRCVRHQILPIAGRKISTGDTNFARMPILQPGQLDAAMAVIAAWDGVDHNLDGLAIEPGEYGSISVSIDKTGEYVASTRDSKARKALGLPNYADDGVVSEEKLVAAMATMNRSRKIAATKLKNQESQAELARKRAMEIITNCQAGFRGNFTLEFASPSGINIHLMSDVANHNGDALAAAAGLNLRFSKSARGWNRWLVASVDSDLAVIATKLNSAIAAFSIRRQAEADQRQAAEAAEQAERAAFKAAADERRREAGWIEVTRRSAGKADGLTGQVVWCGGLPYELVENARKWINNEPSSIAICGTYDFEAESIWCWTGWAKPAVNAAVLIAERDRQATAVDG